MRSFRIVWTGMLSLFFFAAAPHATHADEFHAPGVLVANLDGSFSYEAKFRKEAAPDELGGYGWSGGDNVVGGFFADCFCIAPMCTMQIGDSLTIHVDGQLTDPLQAGTTGTFVEFCTPGTSKSITTVIYPYGTTSVGEPLPEALRFWNAPNPASAGTTLHWVLPRAGAVRLRLYDVAGRQLASLVDEVQSAGHHQAVWDVGALSRADGIYFARLSTAGESRTRVIIVRR